MPEHPEETRRVLEREAGVHQLEEAARQLRAHVRGGWPASDLFARLREGWPGVGDAITNIIAAIDGIDRHREHIDRTTEDPE